MTMTTVSMREVRPQSLCYGPDIGGRAALYMMQREFSMADPDGPPLTVDRGDSQKIIGLKARAADKGAIDVVDTQQFPRVRRRNRSTIQDTHSISHFAMPRTQPLANEAVHLGDILGLRRPAAPDRPDRLLGNGEMRNVGRGAVELGADRGQRLPGFPLVTGFANANNGQKIGAVCRLRLCPYGAVGLPVIVPPLGMADNDRDGAGVFKHFGRDIPCERP